MKHVSDCFAKMEPKPLAPICEVLCVSFVPYKLYVDPMTIPELVHAFFDEGTEANHDNSASGKHTIFVKLTTQQNIKDTSL